MPKSDIKSLLLNSEQISLSSSTCTPTLPSLSLALNQYKQSLDKVHEAKSRSKVLQRQLRKQKSTTINTKKHNEYAQLIKQKINEDRMIKKWYESNTKKHLDQQLMSNKQSRKRIKDNIRNSKSYLYESKLERYEALKDQSQQNQSMINEINTSLMKNRKKNRSEMYREEKERLQQVSSFYQRKQQQIRHSKEKEIKKFFTNSLNNQKIVNQFVLRNLSLKNKRYKEIDLARKLNKNELPINLASTIKNPQQQSSFIIDK